MAVQFGVVHAPKLGTGDEPSARLEDVELARDRTRGCRVVAGDHHGSDMRMPRDSDGGLHLLPRRVDHADDPEQHEIVFDTVRQLDVQGTTGRRGVDAQRRSRDGARGNGQGAERLARKSLVAPRPVAAAIVCQSNRGVLLINVATLCQQDFRRALDEHTQFARAIGIDVNGGVSFAFGCERDLGDPCKARQILSLQAELARRHNQRTLGRIALKPPALVAVRQLRIVDERGGMQRPLEAIAQRRCLDDRLSVLAEFALRDIPAAADLDQRITGDDGAHRHFVAGQGAGLVRADHRCRTKRFDGRQFAHDGVGRRHSAHAETESHGHDCGQRLGNRGNGKRHRKQEQAEHDVERQRRRAEQAGGEHHGANAEHDDSEALAGTVEFLLERRRLLLGGLEQSGDAPDLGVHSGVDDHGAAAAVGRDGARKQHVDAIAEAHVGGDRLRTLGNRHAFAGQRRFIGAKIGVLDDAGVRRDLVSGLHQDDVPRHDLMGCDALAFPVADHGRFRSGERHQRTHRTLRPRFLKESKQRVEHHDGRDDDRLIGQGGFAGVLQ